MRWRAMPQPVWRGGRAGAFGIGDGFSPASLFAYGEQGAWHDPSGLATMFQDHLGTVPAAYGQPVGMIRDKSGRGNHATQATVTARPTLGRVPATGRRNLFTPSENYGPAPGWGKINTAASYDAAEGATLLAETTATGERYLQYTYNAVMGVPFAFSAVVKGKGRLLWLRPAGTPANNSAVLDLTSGTVRLAPGLGTTGITPLGDGYFRVFITSVAAATGPLFLRLQLRQDTGGAGTQTYTGDPAFGIYVKSAQFEIATQPSAYQRVVSAVDVTEDGVASVSYLSSDQVDDALLWTAPAFGYDTVQVDLGGSVVRSTAQALSGAVSMLGSGASLLGYAAVNRQITDAETSALANYYRPLIVPDRPLVFVGGTWWGYPTGSALVNYATTFQGKRLFRVEDNSGTGFLLISAPLNIAAPAESDRIVTLTGWLRKNPDATSLMSYKLGVSHLSPGISINPVTGAVSATSLWLTNLVSRSVESDGDLWKFTLVARIPAGTAVTTLQMFPAHFNISSTADASVMGSHEISAVEITG